MISEKKSWIFASRFEKTKEYEIPTTVTSVSLHPEKSVFVCGGEDFKMYKFDYGSGLEIGKCHSDNLQC
jgi:hypothetical protein